MNHYSVTGRTSTFMALKMNDIGLRNIEGIRMADGKLEIYCKPSKSGKIRMFIVAMTESEATHYPDNLSKSWNSKSNIV